MVHHALPQLRKDKGRIVNIGSYFGSFTPLKLKQISYAASKHAIEAISDGLRRGLAPEGIAVSLVKPGNFKTEMNPEASGDASILAEAVLDAIAQTRPLPRYYIGEVLGWGMYPLCFLMQHSPDWITDKLL